MLKTCHSYQDGTTPVYSQGADSTLIVNAGEQLVRGMIQNQGAMS